MANPTDLNWVDLAVLVSSTDVQTITLDPQRAYTLAHDSEDNTGAADLNTIYLAIAAATDPDTSEGSNKFKLLAGRAVVVGPGVSDLRFETAAGAPTFSVSAGPVRVG